MDATTNKIQRMKYAGGHKAHTKLDLSCGTLALLLLELPHVELQLLALQDVPIIWRHIGKQLTQFYSFTILVYRG